MFIPVLKMVKKFFEKRDIWLPGRDMEYFKKAGLSREKKSLGLKSMQMDSLLMKLNFATLFDR